jgi:glycosyltransferase involved in cell wall biosynthesis
MQIWIDGRSACARTKTGKGQWTLRLIEHLLKHVPLTVCIADGEIPLAWNSHAHCMRRFSSGWRWHWQVAKELKKCAAIYISPTSFIVPSLLGHTVPCIPVLHDLIAFRPDPHEWKARQIEKRTLPTVLRNARHILTLSDATRSDLFTRFAREIGTTPVTTVFSGPLEDVPQRTTDDHHTILCPATLCPRKNQLRLIQAYAALPDTIRQQYRLLLIGARGWQDDEILGAVKRTPGVEWKGYVPDDAYAHILGAASILAFPSLYEGFGLPVLDAMQRGIPVLTSSRGSLREVAGASALLIDPESTEDITRGLMQLATDPALRERLSRIGPLQAAQFSWQRTANLVLSALQSVQGTHS